MSKMKARWQDQFRMFRVEGQTNRCPLILSSGYLSQKRDILAIRAEMFGRIPPEERRRSSAVRCTLKYFGKGGAA